MRLRSFSPSRPPARHGGHDAVEPSIEIGVILCQIGVAQVGSPSSDRDCSQQQGLELRAEHGITAIDGILHIPQQMREAHLPFLRLAALAAECVRHPNSGPNPADVMGKQIRQDTAKIEAEAAGQCLKLLKT